MKIGRFSQTRKICLGFAKVGNHTNFQYKFLHPFIKQTMLTQYLIKCENLQKYCFLLLFVFFNSKLLAQDSRIGLETLYAVEGIFFTNQPSQYLAEEVEQRLNAGLEQSFSTQMIFPIKNTQSQCKIGLGISFQDYSFNNNPPQFTFFFGSSQQSELINEVFVRTSYITLPLAFQHIYQYGKQSNTINFSIWAVPSLNLSKNTAMNFSGDRPSAWLDPLDLELLEEEVTNYYSSKVNPIVTKLFVALGYDWSVNKNVHFLCNMRLGTYVPSLNPEIMKIPFVWGLDVGIKYCW